MKRRSFMQALSIGAPAMAIVKAGEPKRTVRIPLIKELQEKAGPGWLYDKAKKEHIAIISQAPLQASPMFGMDTMLGYEESMQVDRLIFKPTGFRTREGKYEYLLNYIEPYCDDWSYVSNARGEKLYPIPRSVTEAYKTTTKTVKEMR